MIDPLGGHPGIDHPVGIFGAFQLLLISNVLSEHGLPDRGTRLPVVSHDVKREEVVVVGDANVFWLRVVVLYRETRSACSKVLTPNNYLEIFNFFFDFLI
jgi:hypothetical protein